MGSHRSGTEHGRRVRERKEEITLMFGLGSVVLTAVAAAAVSRFPIRACYPQVALHSRAAHVLGSATSWSRTRNGGATSMSRREPAAHASVASRRARQRY